MRYVLLLLIGVWFIQPAMADCQCGCVNGKPITVCTKPTDPPMICSNVCVQVPSATPRVTVQPSYTPPPVYQPQLRGFNSGFANGFSNALKNSQRR